MHVECVPTVHGFELLYGCALSFVRIVWPELALIDYAIDMPNRIVHSEFYKRPKYIECHIIDHNVANIFEPVRVEICINT
jgi:hypothetical protein